VLNGGRRSVFTCAQVILSGIRFLEDPGYGSTTSTWCHTQVTCSTTAWEMCGRISCPGTGNIKLGKHILTCRVHDQQSGSRSNHQTGTRWILNSDTELRSEDALRQRSRAHGLRPRSTGALETFSRMFPMCGSEGARSRRKKLSRSQVQREPGAGRVQTGFQPQPSCVHRVTSLRIRWGGS